MVVALDLTGQTFGKRTVLRRAENNARGGTRWVVQCECGDVGEAEARNLISGKSQSCLRCRRKRPTTAAPVGTRFGSRTVIAVEPGTGTTRGMRVVRCDCGRVDRISAYAVAEGNSDRCLDCSYRGKSEKASRWREDVGVPRWYLSRARAGAASRGFEFAMSDEEVRRSWDLSGGLCALTGWPIGFGPAGTHTTTASLDRIDSSRGYTEDNVQWVHKIVNAAKMSADQSEFVRMCTAVAARQQTGE